ncbi:hypothetical protein P3X46_003990 [Hevea brasiliensis]|uniref:Uncharacterized protein n=1 Tax=Hevea brasiliensis TaxID=3981 RepID=A0ABQ9MXN9_HEVBR|nr:hypothetical protein P3X46_003990 [Hevea brasiliensis]
MRSSSGTYSWFVAAREGTLKEKPRPERMEWVRERIKDSMADWTESRERSVTSRHAEERERSERVKGLEEVEEEEEVDFKRECRDSRITESGFRRFLKGSWSWSEEEDSGSARRRFLALVVSAISGSWEEAGNGTVPDPLC